MNLYRTDSLAFKAELAPLPDGIKARIPSKFMTAWRTIQVGDKAVDLINSSLILNLNEPSKIADTSWIKTAEIYRRMVGTASRHPYMDNGTPAWSDDGECSASY